MIAAMLAARPIVATTAGGIIEALGAYGSGNEAATAWLTPPRNAAALAGAILSALNAPMAERAARAANARKRAEELFTAQHMVTRTLDVYAEFFPAQP